MHRKLVLILAIVAVACLLMAGNGVRLVSAFRTSDSATELPERKVDRETYVRLRQEHVGRLRGLSSRAVPVELREAAIKQMSGQEEQHNRAISLAPEVIPTWTELGPKPLINGETQDPAVTTTVSGRATAVVVDPTNSNKVYLGTAQGGVWRSLDGGNTWTTIFDGAQSLAVGALALAPSSSSTLYVGTGEHAGGFVNDAFFGVGVYRIDNADTTATLVGPINPSFSFTSIFNQPTTTTCFSGRAISKIVVHPTNPAIIFVSTTGSFSGISGLTLGSEIPPLGLRGLYRSTNATSAAGSVTFQKLAVTSDASFDQPGTGNTSIFDMVLEPGNPNILLATAAGSSPPIGGVFRSTNALAANPGFTQTLTPTLEPDGLAMRLAINKVGSTVTVYVTSNEASSCPGEKGRVRKSSDGGLNWIDLPAADGFCGGLCIYDNPIAVDPNNAKTVYLGGSARGACADVLQRSEDGGTTFVRDDTGLNSSAHAVFIDSNTAPATIWFACDGGVWKRPDNAAGMPWVNRNNAALGSLQFQSVAVHPTDPNFIIGGTQDNGTEAQQGSPGNWISAEGGDGGFALIDQGAVDTNTVTMYHTFANLTNVLVGFSRTNLGACLGTKNSWEFRGAGAGVDPGASCDGTAKKAANGLNLADAVNFYAPMALGPGSPNTLYFGTDRLYRSVNRGDTMNVVSQGPLSSKPVSAIAVSRSNDNIRMVGTSDGKVFATVTGASTLTDITPALPNDPNGDPSPNLKYISRLAIDPGNPNVAYLALSYYTPAGQGIFKTTNLNLTGTGSVSWSAMGNGIPSIPVNAFVIDPSDSSHLFAGTDIGVYSSADGGANWSPYGTGLPKVAVFDLAIQPTSHTLRAATHGRGMWEITASTTQTVNVSLPHVLGALGSVISIPVTVGDVTGQAARAYDLQVTFNAAIIKPCVANECGGGPTEKPFDKTGTLSQDMTVTANTNNTGHLIISAFQTDDMIGSGTLLNLRFHVVGAPGQNSPLTFADYTDPNPTFHPGFRFNAGNPQAATSNGSVTVNGPTAGASRLSGRVTNAAGEPVAGVTVTVMGGARAIRAITNSDGYYVVEGLETGGFYTVTPTRGNFMFAPQQRSFSLIADRTDAVFTGSGIGADEANPLESPEFFVRQQYLDFLSREPEQAGLDFWSGQLRSCGANEECIRQRRLDVSAAFFISQEFADSGLFIHDVYQSAFGRRPDYTEYVAGRMRVVGGSQLEADKAAFVLSFVQRDDFVQQYPTSLNEMMFVDALLARVRQSSGIDLTAERSQLLDVYGHGASAAEGRSLVLRAVAENNSFKESQYNGAFVFSEYFSYLNRNPDQAGYEFWLNVLDRDHDYRGMVCSFVTSFEYQRRFATVITRNNFECR